MHAALECTETRAAVVECNGFAVEDQPGNPPVVDRPDIVDVSVLLILVCADVDVSARGPERAVKVDG